MSDSHQESQKLMIVLPVPWYHTWRDVESIPQGSFSFVLAGIMIALVFVVVVSLACTHHYYYENISKCAHAFLSPFLLSE